MPALKDVSLALLTVVAYGVIGPEVQVAVGTWDPVVRLSVVSLYTPYH